MPLGADRRLVACGGYAAQVAGCIVFIFAAGTNVPLLLAGVVLFGVGFGNATSLPPLIAQVEFVKEDVPRVAALIGSTDTISQMFSRARVRRNVMPSPNGKHEKLPLVMRMASTS